MQYRKVLLQPQTFLLLEKVHAFVVLCLNGLLLFFYGVFKLNGHAYLSHCCLWAFAFSITRGVSGSVYRRRDQINVINVPKKRNLHDVSLWRHLDMQMLCCVSANTAGCSQGLIKDLQEGNWQFSNTHEFMTTMVSWTRNYSKKPNKQTTRNPSIFKADGSSEAPGWSLAAFSILAYRLCAACGLCTRRLNLLLSVLQQADRQKFLLAVVPTLSGLAFVMCCCQWLSHRLPHFSKPACW